RNRRLCRHSLNWQRIPIGGRDASALGDATDVVADSGRRDVTLVSDAAADRLAVARMVVCAENAERGVARLHAPLELLQAALVDRTERLDRAHRPLSYFSSARRNWADRTAVSRFASARLAARPRCGLSRVQPRAFHSTTPERKREERESNPQGPKTHPCPGRDTAPVAVLPQEWPREASMFVAAGKSRVRAGRSAVLYG